MARQRPQPEDTAAIFARIPRAEAEKLERLSYELRRPKQQIIAGLLAQYSPEDEPSERADAGLAVGRYGFRSPVAPEVLTLEQLAVFLQIDEQTARALADAGQIPGREIAGEWRFSREAVVAWLAAEPE